MGRLPCLEGGIYAKNFFIQSLPSSSFLPLCPFAKETIPEASHMFSVLKKSNPQEANMLHFPVQGAITNLLNI
jgi:hypothetical protein